MELVYLFVNQLNTLVQLKLRHPFLLARKRWRNPLSCELRSFLWLHGRQPLTRLLLLDHSFLSWLPQTLADLNKARFTADQIKDLDFRVVSHIDSHHNFSIPISNILNIHSLSFFDGISNDHIVIFLCVFGDVLIRKNYESLSTKRFCQLFVTFVSKKGDFKAEYFCGILGSDVC